ncbi:signal peptidase II [bacterium]|nr:signal peptidase II [bacterium]
MKRYAPGALLFALLLALDQASKALILKGIRPYRGVEVLGNLLRITNVRNSGGAFSTRFGGNGFYLVVAGLASLFVIVYIVRSADTRVALRIALFAILAGAFGNLIDRIRFGEVIDWIDVGIGNTRWPTFNIADSAIVIGLIILVFTDSNERKKGKNNGAAGHPADEAGSIPRRDGAGAEP